MEGVPEMSTSDAKVNPHIMESFPLSPMQQGMVFHYLAAPHSGGDIEQIVCSLRESLNIQAFREAWDRVVSRHAVLRTGFRWEETQEPLQEVHQKVTVPFLERD